MANVSDLLGDDLLAEAFEGPKTAAGRRPAVRRPSLLQAAWRDLAGLARGLGRLLLVEPERGALWLPVCVAVGDGSYFLCRLEPQPWLPLLVLSCGLLLLLAARRVFWVRAPGAALLAASVGFLAAMLATWRAPPLVDLPRFATQVSGRVSETELFADGSRRITLEAPRLGDDLPLPRRLRIRLRRDDDVQLVVGERAQVRALLHPPSPPSYPGGRDPQREAFFNGLAGSGVALGLLEATPPAPGGARPILASRLQRLREAIAGRITRTLPGPSGAIATTLLTGISTAIPPEDRQAFAVSGLAHLLAVAGLHLGIVMGLTMGGLRMALAAWEYAALRWPTRQLAAVGALANGIVYMLLTGLHLPTIRSVAMASLAVLALLLGRRAASMRGLAVAALILLLCKPAVLLEVSFQMSFAAVLALIAGYEAVRHWLTRLQFEGGAGRRLLLHVFGLFLTSLLAGAASLPYAAYHFGHIQFYFVLANLVAVPLTALWVMPEGLLSLFLMPLGLERFALLPMSWGIDIILWLARAVARLPAASVAVRAMPLWGLGVISFGLVWLCLRRGPPRLLGLLPICLGLLTPWIVRPPDLLVSSDARLIALRTAAADGAVLLVARQPGANTIDLAVWTQAQAAPAVPLDTATGATVPACDAGVCRIRERGRLVLLLRNVTATRQAPADCAAVELVVSPVPAGRFCLDRRRIDRFTVWREGAQAVWIGPGRTRVLSDRDIRGQRPWIPVPGHRRVPNLPMAASE